MFFNPLFMQSISEASVQTASANSKLSNSKYLFSDIIKVFNESDPTAASTVLPESTSVSSAPEIFSFQSPDLSNGVKYQDQKSVEGNNNQNILELISSILFANTTPVEPLQIENGLQKLPGSNTNGTLILSPGSKEFEVQSENLSNLLAQLLSAAQTAGTDSTKTATSASPLPNEKTNLEVLAPEIMKKLETGGEAIIQIENAGQNIQFKISKIDETKNENSLAAASTVAQMPTAIQSAENTGQLNVTAKTNKPDQSSLKEIVKETPVEAGVMVESANKKVFKKAGSASNKINSNPGEIKISAAKPVTQPGNIDSELDKLISQAIDSGVDASATGVTADKTNSKSNIINSATTGEENGIISELKSTEASSKTTEVQSGKIEIPSQETEIQPIKTEMQSGKPEVQTDKAKIQLKKTDGPASNNIIQPSTSEALTDKNFGKISKSEVQLNNAAQPTAKNYAIDDLQKLSVESKIVESETQINKVVNSKLNLNSESLIHALDVESAVNPTPKILFSYKIVMQVGEKEAKLPVSDKNVDVINLKPSPILSTSVSADEKKNLTLPKPANTSSVKTILDSIKQALNNESSVSLINGLENKKINVSGDQNKVEAADINLLNRLSLTNAKLASTFKLDTEIKVADNRLEKSATPLPEQIVAETIPAAPDQGEINFSNEPTSKTAENLFGKKPVSEEVRKGMAVHKSVDTFAQQGNTETKKSEQQIFNQSSKPVVKQSIETSMAAPVLNEPLNVKSKNEGEPNKNSPEVQKISSQSEIEKPVVKTLMTNSEFSADTKGQQAPTEVNAPKEGKHEAAKSASDVEETKPAETQQNVSTNHQTHEIKITAPKEKISSTSFQLPETERTIKSFELNKEIAKIIESGTSQKVVLRLLPEALGKVKITLEVGGEIIHAKAEVENESVRQIVQTNTETLKQTLSQNGLQLASFNVSLADSDEKQQKAHGQKKRSNSFSSKSKIEKQVLPEATRTLGYNTYEYLA